MEDWRKLTLYKVTRALAGCYPDVYYAAIPENRFDLLKIAAIKNIELLGEVLLPEAKK